MRQRPALRPSAPRGPVPVGTLPRALLALTLAAALLAPKLSLAVVAAFGDGYASVVVCTGTGLARVAVAPDGRVVAPDEASEAWSVPHCVLPDAATERLERAWSRFAFPRDGAAVVASAPSAALPPRTLRPALGSRAPPRA